jgi:hypothetical protein
LIVRLEEVGLHGGQVGVHLLHSLEGLHGDTRKGVPPISQVTEGREEGFVSLD